MPDCAGSLAQLLESDLLQAGWDPGFIGPRPVAELAYQSALSSLSNSLLKKYISYEERLEKDPERERKALALFLANNEDCRVMQQSLEERSTSSKLIEEAFGEVRSVLYDLTYPNNGRGIVFSLGTILSEADMGPGANVGAINNDFYTKLFGSPLTASNADLHDFYAAHVSSNPVWLDAEKSREARFGTRLVSGSKLFFAPKTREIARVACTEPILNMFFQKGMQTLLEQSLRRVFGIDLRGDAEKKILSQPDKNRELARLGSMYGTYGTIDLSSASDRISWDVVKWLFPEPAVRWFGKTRSPMTILPDGTLQELYMVSSMGNAFTFPLETAIFASVVVAVYRVLGINIEYPRGRTLGNFAVFGDDIIVVREAYDLVCEMLQILGHKVNHDKSFNSGLFRESCGSDWFSGRNVRGVYIKRLHSDTDIYKAINRLNIWSGRNGVPLERTVRYLLTRCKRRLYVPMHEQDAAGIRTPLQLLSDASQGAPALHGSAEISQHLYPRTRAVGIGGRTLEYRCLAPWEVRLDLSDSESFLRGQLRSFDLLARVLPSGQRRSLERRRAAVEQAMRRFGFVPGERARGRRGDKHPRNHRARGRLTELQMQYLSKIEYNASGVLLSAVAFRLGTGFISIRTFSDKSVLRVRTSPCWDYCGPELSMRAAEAFHLLCLVNLGEVY